MVKMLVMLMVLGVLALSARMTYASPQDARSLFGRNPSSLEQSAPLGYSLAASVAAPVLQPPRLADDGSPPTALLVYLAFVVIGSIVGVALVRRIQRDV